MKIVALVVLAIAAGALIISLLVRTPRTDAPRLGEDSVVADAPAASEHDAAVLLAAEEPSRASSTLAIAPSEPPTPAPTSLAGTVVVLDENGIVYSHEEGRLALELRRRDAITYHEVLVAHGRWSSPSDSVIADGAAASLLIGECVLGGRPAVLDAQDPVVAVPADGGVALRLRWLAPPLLHVRAREDGRELEDVVVCELPARLRHSLDDLERPGTELIESARPVGPSPVRLEALGAGLGARVVFARSPGFAWGRVVIDATEAESTLLLDRASELELVLDYDPWPNWSNWAEVEVREAKPPGRRFLDASLGREKQLLLADLPAGRYVAEVRVNGRLIGSVEAEVLAGERAHATLLLHEPASRVVPLAGVLVLPEAWDHEDFTLEFGLRGRRDDGVGLSDHSFRIHRAEMTPDADSRERFRWAHPALQDSRFTAGVFGIIGFSAEMDTGSAGDVDVRIEVPPPGVLSVHLVDARTGIERESGRLAYTWLDPHAPAKRRSMSTSGLPWEPWFPQGLPVWISTDEPGYAEDARVVIIGAGRNEVRLRLELDDQLVPLPK